MVLLHYFEVASSVNPVLHVVHSREEVAEHVRHPTTLQAAWTADRKEEYSTRITHSVCMLLLGVFDALF